MDAIDRFDTQRLQAERLRATDFGDVYRMNQNSRVMKIIGGIYERDIVHAGLPEALYRVRLGC